MTLEWPAPDAGAEWLASLAHEMRSPLAAILGYQELLLEGTFGELTPTARDAAERTAAAALQLLALADGLDRVAADPAVFDEPTAETPADELITAAVNVIRQDAEARNVTIDVRAASGSARIRRTEAVRTLALALSAAVKVSAGATVHVAVVPDGEAIDVRITGTGLSPHRDDALTLAATASSGAALRLFLARAAARAAPASVHLSGASGDAILSVRFGHPHPIDGAEDRP